MKPETKDKLFEAWAYCDEADKSTEFTLQYMSDYAGVEYDVAVQFVVRTTDEQRSEWYKKQRHEK
jgi:hypothetical protein